MYRFVLLALVGVLPGEAAIAQNSWQQQTLDFQSTIRGIEEVRSLKIEAAEYFYGGRKKKNKKLACITIQQAYEVELRMGDSNSSTRADIRQYCG